MTRLELVDQMLAHVRKLKDVNSMTRAELQDHAEESKRLTGISRAMKASVNKEAVSSPEKS